MAGRSKQDGTYTRTASDLEQKYNFGQTFAEVYGLISGVKQGAEESVKELDAKLDPEEIFNRLTNFGKAQGIYRDDAGNVYVNASYIKSGKLAAEYIDADNLKVKAANVTGTLEATQINTKDLKVLAANITGTLTAGQIDTTFLTVSAANITGKLTAGQIDATNLKVSAANVTGKLTAGQIDATNLSIVGGRLYATGQGSYFEVTSSGFELWGTDTKPKIKLEHNSDLSFVRLMLGAGSEAYQYSDKGRLLIEKDADAACIWYFSETTGDGVGFSFFNDGTIKVFGTLVDASGNAIGG